MQRQNLIFDMNTAVHAYSGVTNSVSTVTTAVTALNALFPSLAPGSTFTLTTRVDSITEDQR
ncbi:MAG: hypothetical protein EXR08_08370 [Alphaproteobacteria bacterium]|nr:hypothetical protein [Alphaproteobacteria bacterium]